MAEIIREFITVEPTEEASDSLFKSLSKQYAPVIQSTFLKICGLLRLPTEKNHPASRLGELFVAPNSGFFYYLKFSSGFEVGSIAKEIAKDNHERFMKSVLSALRGERQPIQSANRTFSLLSQDLGHFSFNEEDRQSAKLLTDASTRNYVRDVVAAGRKERSDKDTVPSDAVLEELRKLDLLRPEFFIFCRQSGKQIMMVESMAAIEEASRHGFKCFTCGRPFSEEKLTQFVSRAPNGRKMSGENRWLLANCMEALEDWLGAKRFCVLADGEVTDLFFSLHSSLVFIEIKESPYQLKDAYLFSRKIGVYKPAASFLLHLSPLSEEAERYLESHDAPSFFAEGDSLQSMKESLPKWGNLASQHQVEEVLQRFTELSMLALDDLALSSLFSQEPLPPSGGPLESREKMPEAKDLPPAILPQEPETLPPPAKAELLPEEPAADTWEARTAILEKLALELSGDITGRESNLHVLLQDLGDLPRRWKACLLSEDGLVVASTLDEETSEILASFGGECFLITEKILGRKNHGTLSTITLASKNFSAELSHLPGFYLALTANLETIVPPPLSASTRAEIFKSISAQLFLKRNIQSIALLNKKGKVMFETTREEQSTPSFSVSLEVFTNLASPFESFGQGTLEAVAIRSLSFRQTLSQAGQGYLGLSCNVEQIWEDLFPSLLAFADQIAARS